MMERFRIDLKTFLSLAMPNQYCQNVNVKLVLELGQNPLTFMVSIYRTTVQYDMAWHEILCDLYVPNF